MALNSNTIEKRVEDAINRTPGLEKYIAQKVATRFVLGALCGFGCAVIAYMLIVL